MKNVLLINSLSKTINLLKNTKDYQWGHNGSCNCGHVAQALTGLSKKEIHEYAMEKEGDWREKANLFCETSGKKIDSIIKVMLSNGFSLEDIGDIEYLSNPKVLKRIEKRELNRNELLDVLLYLETWKVILQGLSEDWNPKVSNKREVEIYDSVPEYEYV